MSTVNTKKVYVLFSVKAFDRMAEYDFYSDEQRRENAIMISASPVHESCSGEYILIAEREVSFAMPELSDMVEMTAAGLEQSLQKMRAEHQRQQQELIDSIARHRQLTYVPAGE